MSRVGHEKLAGAVRALARAVLLVLTAFSILSSTVRAGSSYVFCTQMGEVRDEPCCAAEDDRSTDVPTLTADCDCCQTKRVAALPRAIEGRTFVPPRLPLLAAAPTACGLAARLMAALKQPPSPRFAGARAGPPPPLGRTRSMVFLI